MAMLSFCGIDLAKDRLDVIVLPEQQSFAVRNAAASWAELISVCDQHRRQLAGRSATAAFYPAEPRQLVSKGGPKRGDIGGGCLIFISAPQYGDSPKRVRPAGRAQGVTPPQRCPQRQCSQ
jgi:hypothetical protein